MFGWGTTHTEEEYLQTLSPSQREAHYEHKENRTRCGQINPHAKASVAAAAAAMSESPPEADAVEVATTALGRLTHCPPPLRRFRAKKGQIQPTFSISGAKTVRKVMKTEESHSRRSPLHAPLAVKDTPVITSSRSGKIARQSDTSDSNRAQNRPKIDLK